MLAVEIYAILERRYPDYRLEDSGEHSRTLTLDGHDWVHVLRFDVRAERDTVNCSCGVTLPTAARLLEHAIPLGEMRLHHPALCTTAHHMAQPHPNEFLPITPKSTPRTLANRVHQWWEKMRPWRERMSDPQQALLVHLESAEWRFPYAPPLAGAYAKAMAIAHTLGQEDQVRTLLEDMITSFLERDPDEESRRHKLPHWANDLLLYAHWARDHLNVATVRRAELNAWCRRCIDSDLKLSAALGLLGQQARQEVQAEFTDRQLLPPLWPIDRD